MAISLQLKEYHPPVFFWVAFLWDDLVSNSRSLASCWVKGTDESFPRVDSQIINPDSD